MATVADVFMTEAEYHAHDAISASKQKTFRKSRKLYKALYVDKTIPQKQTDAMLLGSLTHCMTFEPDLVHARYIKAPKVDRRTKQGKEDWQAFLDESNGKTVVDDDTWNRAFEMRFAVLDNQAARQLINADGVCERPVFWRHPTLDLDCRARMDKILDSGVILDLKTCTDATPYGFVKSIVNYGYDYQAAWYCEGFKQVYGDWPNFVFIAVQSEPPYEVGIYEISEGDLLIAVEANTETAAALASCLASGNWEQDHERDVVKLTLPGYAKFRDDYRY